MQLLTTYLVGFHFIVLHCQHNPCIAFPVASHVQLCVIQAAPRGIDTGVRYVRMIPVMNTVSPFTFSQFEARIMLSVPMLVYVRMCSYYVRMYVHMLLGGMTVLMFP